MTSISLTIEQAAVVRETLLAYHNTLLLELSKTDSRGFREILRNREAIVADVLDQLAPTAAAPA